MCTGFSTIHLCVSGEKKFNLLNASCMKFSTTDTFIKGVTGNRITFILCMMSSLTPNEQIECDSISSSTK